MSNKNWYPERLFYSHATRDESITSNVRDAIKNLHPEYELFISEHKVCGIPLVQRLKEEMLNCNGLVIGWTKNASEKKTSEMISFEIGMAYSLGIPIYLLKFPDTEVPWFFNHVDQHIDIPSEDIKDIKEVLQRRIDIFSFLHPIDLFFPKEPHPKKSPEHSKNYKVVQDDASMIFERGFNDILHYRIINRRSKPEKAVRIQIIFPKVCQLEFNKGFLEPIGPVRRNDLFDVFQTTDNRLTITWPNLPLDVDKLLFEVKVIIPQSVNSFNHFIKCKASSDNIVNMRTKYIPIRVG